MATDGMKSKVKEMLQTRVLVLFQAVPRGCRFLSRLISEEESGQLDCAGTVKVASDFNALT